jgi:hypothetical protein
MPTLSLAQMRLQPSAEEEQAQRNIALNQYLSDAQDQRNVRDQSLRAMTAQNDAVDAQAQDRQAIDRAMASGGSFARPIVQAGGPGHGNVGPTQPNTYQTAPAGPMPSPAQAQANILAQLPGHLQAPLQQHWAATDKVAADASEARGKAAEAQGKAADAQAEYEARFGDSVHAMGDDPQATAALVANAKASGHDISRFVSLVGGDPANIKNAAEAMVVSGPGYAKEAETKRSDMAKEAAANPFGLNPTGSAAQAPAAGSAPSGTPGAAPGQGLSGDAFLKTLPTGLGLQVKSYAEGRQAFPTGFALKAPYFQQMLQAVGQYDPSFDAINYNARNKLYSDLTSTNGKGGKAIGALNTAAQHLGRLSDAVEAEGNTNYPMLNAVENPTRTAFGSTKVTDFNAVQPQAMKEIESLWRSQGGSQKDIDELKASLGPNMGLQQQRSALAVFADLMGGKLDSLQGQRDSGLGPVASQRVPILYNKSRPAMLNVYQRAGKTPPDIFTGANASAAPAPGGPAPRVNPFRK